MEARVIRMKRALFVINSKFPFFGTPAPYEFAKAAVTNGFPVDVLAISSSDDIPLQENVNGIDVFRTRTNRSDRSPSTIEKLASHLNILIHKTNYGLVHVFTFRGSTYLRLRNHTPQMKWLLHIISGNIYGGARSRIGNLLTRFEMQFFDRIIVNSEEIAIDILKTKKFDVVPVGVNLDRFFVERDWQLRDNLGYDENDILAVYSGAVTKTRRIGTLLEGFKHAREYSPNLKLMIIGTGDHSHVQLLVDELDLQDSVRLVGPLLYPDVPPYVSIGDIGLAYVPIMPEYDPQPVLKTLEFLAAGKPVLATATLGNAKIVQDNQNGLLVQDTPQDLANGLNKLVQDSTLRERLSQAARPSVQQYTWNEIFRNRLLPIYRSLLS
jgi:glycosyltransferase involved in cell wall biosynthesis